MSVVPSRVNVPSWPFLEPSGLGSFAIVGEEIWCPSPRGVSVRAAPGLERVRDVALPFRADALAASADGRLVAVLARHGLYENRLGVLDPTDGRLLCAFDATFPVPGHAADGSEGLRAGFFEAACTEIELSDDGRLLLASSSTTTRAWALDEAGRPEEPGAHRSYVRASAASLALRAGGSGPFGGGVACSADGRFLTDGGRVVDRRTGEELAKTPAARGDPCAAFSPDGEALARNDVRGHLTVLSGRRFERERTFSAPGGYVRWCTNELVVAGRSRPSVLRASDGRVLGRFEPRPRSPSGVFSPVLLGGEAGTLVVRADAKAHRAELQAWSVATGLAAALPGGAERLFADRDASDDGRVRVCLAVTGHAYVMGDREEIEGGLDLQREGPPLRLCEHPGQIVWFAVARSGRAVLSRGGGHALLSLPAEGRCLRLAADLAVRLLRFDATEQGAVVADGWWGSATSHRGGGGTETRLYDLAGGLVSRAPGPVVCAAGHLPSATLAIGLAGGELELWRAGARVHADDFHRASIQDLVLSGDGRLLASVDGDGVMRVLAVPPEVLA